MVPMWQRHYAREQQGQYATAPSKTNMALLAFAFMGTIHYTKWKAATEPQAELRTSQHTEANWEEWWVYSSPCRASAKFTKSRKELSPLGWTVKVQSTKSGRTIPPRSKTSTTTWSRNAEDSSRNSHWMSPLDGFKHIKTTKESTSTNWTGGQDRTSEWTKRQKDSGANTGEIQDQLNPLLMNCSRSP